MTTQKKKSILVTSKEYGKDSAELIQKYLENKDIRLIKLNRTGPMNEDQLLEALPGYGAVISYSAHDYFTSCVICGLPDLKVIARHGIGYDTIDVESATKQGIYVCTTAQGAHEERAVADLTIGLLLSLARRIVALDRVVKSGGWERPLGKDLLDKTLGIIGLGKIGKEVALRAAGFGLKLTAYDPYIDEDFASRHNIQYVSLEQLLAQSDYISLHVPLNGKTQGMIGTEQINSMKHGSYFINCARSALVDEEALVRAIKSGHLAGAGIDVYDNEPPSPDSPLLKLENVITVPHIAAYTEDTIGAMDMLVLEMCVDVLEGKKPRNALNGREL